MTNPDIVRVIKARLEDCRCYGEPVPPQGFKPCGGCEHDTRCLVEIVELRRERDEAQEVMRSVVEEFVQHGQPMNPFYPPTPPHGCEFKYNPECGKCDACEAWSDYVRICHPLERTDEEETP